MSKNGVKNLLRKHWYMRMINIIIESHNGQYKVQ